LRTITTSNRIGSGGPVQARPGLARPGPALPADGPRTSGQTFTAGTGSRRAASPVSPKPVPADESYVDPESALYRSVCLRGTELSKEDMAKILIVDNDKEQAKVLLESLREKGHTVESTAKGRVGIER